MPRISVFYGIAIYMYFRDHAPPHFHAQYAGEEAVIAIEDGRVIRGEIPIARCGSCENGSKRTAPSWTRTGDWRASRRRFTRSTRCRDRPAPHH